MLTAPHPAWRTAIIPFLNDQQLVDQLWCSSKQLQPVIRSSITKLTCWCRPMDTPVKRRGIYPSYISQLTALKTLTVKILPRLNLTWGNKLMYQCMDDELFFPNLPSSVRYFDTDVRTIGLSPKQVITEDQEQEHDSRDGISDGISDELDNILSRMMSWLVRYPNITIGKTFRKCMVETYQLTEHWTEGKDLVLLMCVCPSHLTNEEAQLIYRALEDRPYLSQLLQIIVNTVTTITVWNNGDEVWKLPQLYHNVSDLRQANGKPLRVLPSSLHSYRWTGEREGYKLKYLTAIPDTLTALDLTIRDPVDFTHLLKLRLPERLRSLKLYFHYVYRSHYDVDAICMEEFHQLLRSLPATLTHLNLRSNSNTDVINSSDYYPVELVQALPRGLLYFNCDLISYCLYNPMIDQDTAAALPPSLTVLNSAHYYSTYLTVLFPRTLRKIRVNVDSLVTLSELGRVVQCFPNLSDLRIQLELEELKVSAFPQLVLPKSLKKFSVQCGEPKNVFEGTITLPLEQIVWPDQMNSVNIKAGSWRSSVSVTQWSLPRRLASLYMEDVIVGQLPIHWPLGLRRITAFTHLSSKSSRELVSEAWPNIEEMGRYLPDRRMCKILHGVGNGDDNADHHACVTDPITGTSKFIVIGHSYWAVPG